MEHQIRIKIWRTSFFSFLFRNLEFVRICVLCNILKCIMLIHKIHYHWQGWKISSKRGLHCNQSVRRMGLVMKQLQVARGLLFCCCCSSLDLSVLSAHKLDYFIRVQASIASATAVFFTLPSSLHLSLSLSLSSSLSLCSQRQDLKQHG